MPGLRWRETEGGVEISVRVASGASRTRVVGVYGDRLKVQVSAAPERGQANRALGRLLASVLTLPVSSVVVVQGHASPDKVVRLTGIDGLAVVARIRELESQDRAIP